MSKYKANTNRIFAVFFLLLMLSGLLYSSSIVYSEESETDNEQELDIEDLPSGNSGELNQNEDPATPADEVVEENETTELVEAASETIGNISSGIEFAPDEPDAYFGGRTISIYNKLKVSGANTILEAGAYTEIYLAKDKFTKPVKEDIDISDDFGKDLEIIETDTEYIIKTSYKKIPGGYSANRPVKVRLLPGQTVNASVQTIRQALYNSKGEKIGSGSSLEVRGKADIESPNDGKHSPSNIIGDVDENRRIKEGKIVGFPYNGWRAPGEAENDPRVRRIFVTLPEDAKMAPGHGWISVEGSGNKWYKDLKRHEMKSTAMQAYLDLAGINMSQHTSPEKSKEITLNYSMHVIDQSGVVQDDIAPKTWVSSRKYYIKGEGFVGSRYCSMQMGFVNREYEVIDQVFYAPGRPQMGRIIIVPYNPEDIANYRMEIKIQKILSGLKLKSLGDEDTHKLTLVESDTETAEYTYPSEICLTLSFDQDETDEIKDDVRQFYEDKLRGTKAWGIKHNDVKVLLTDNVPIVEQVNDPQANYFKLADNGFNGKEYKKIVFEYPNGGIVFENKEKIEKYKDYLTTSVIADLDPVIVDELRKLLDKGEEPVFPINKTRADSSSKSNTEYTSPRFDKVISSEYQTFCHDYIIYMLNYDRMGRNGPIQITNGDSFFSGDIVKTELKYRHIKYGSAFPDIKPNNLNVYYLVPDGFEPIDNPELFSSVKLQKGYKPGYNLVIAKPRPEKIKIPDSVKAYSSVINKYNLDFKITNRIVQGSYDIHAAISIDNNKIENRDNRQDGIIQDDKPQDLWNTITEDADNRPSDKTKFTNLRKAGFRVHPPKELVAIKDVKMVGETNLQYSSSLGDRATIGDGINYRLRLRNSSTEVVRQLTLIDILPFPGDKSIIANKEGKYLSRESQFNTPLTGVEDQDKFDIFYSTDPVQATIDQNKVAHWLNKDDFDGDLSKVTMIKADLKAGQVLDVDEEFSIVTINRIENNPEIEDGEKANNSFAFSTNNGIDFIESLKVEAQVSYPKRDVKIIKVDFDDEKIKLEGVKFDLYSSADKLLQTGLITDQQGVIIIQDLIVNKTYYLRETATANGYVIRPDKIEFTVPSLEENPGTFEITVKNKKDIPGESKPSDPDQPIVITSQPSPEQPDVVSTSKPKNPAAGSKVPRTGESSSVKTYGPILLILGLVLISIRRKVG